MKNITYTLSLLVLIPTLSHCGGGGGGGGSQKYAGFDLDMPAALDDLNTDYVRVSGSVDGGEATDALLTIRGDYALPVKGLKTGDTYEYELTVYYQADAYTATDISDLVTRDSGLTTSIRDTSAKPLATIEISTDIAACPDLSVSPDDSLTSTEDGIQWLRLCTATVTATYDPAVAIDVAAESIVCDTNDADGDGSNNLNELALTYDPYNGDYDGDCVTDGEDAFPTDPDEWADADGDGVGDNADSDVDADGLSASAEAALGTDPTDADSDDDSVGDGEDNCPLYGDDADQTDTDSDGSGDACDTDDDDDDLTDAEEATLGSDPLDSDSDNDGRADGREVTEGTDPTNDDTDGDGVGDDEDIFPLDATESTDEDDDGIGANADLCDDVADSTNTDTDGDLSGDVCDSDDDGDGVLDTVETTIGSDPLDADTDDDGLTDWFGGSKDVTQDGCLLVVQTGSDADGDGFESDCDCNDSNEDANPAETDTPDAAGVDNDCDGIDGVITNSVFVDGATGSDSNDGSQFSPLATIAAGIALAQSEDKDLLVAEATYAQTETLEISDSVAIYGGYLADFTDHDIYDNTTTISGADIGTLISATLENDEELILHGLSLTHSELSSDDSTAVLVTGGSVTMSQDVIVASGAYYATTIRLDSTDVTLTGNSLQASGGTNIGIGINVTNTTGVMSSNEILVSDFTLERTGIRCSSAGDSDITVTNVTFDVWAGTAASTSGYNYVVDCSPDPSRNHFEVPLDDVATWDGFAADSTIVLDGLF